LSSDSDDPRSDESVGPPAASLGRILDSISEGVFSVDEEWRITSLNRAAEELLGIRRSEALGRLCHEVFQTDLCDDACPLRYTRETGLPIRNHAVSFVDAEGRRIPVSISTNLLRDGRGVVIGACQSFDTDTYATTARCVEDSKLMKIAASALRLKIAASALRHLMDDDLLMGYVLQRHISHIYFERYLETMKKLQAIVMNLPIDTES
jgi:PAS domain S-box-containing protein